MDLVSVIIPTYNRCSLVIEAVKSVLQQTYKNLEVIVVDDGSIDDTGQAIKAIGDPRVCYYYRANGGVSAARNLGLKYAKGDYICFLDSDDLWPDNFLVVMLDSLDKNPEYGAAYCAREIVYSNGKRVQSGRLKYSKSGWITANLFFQAFIQTSTLCFRRETLNGFSFEERLRTAEDLDAWLKLSTKTQFLFVRNIQIEYRTAYSGSPHPRLSDDPGAKMDKISVLERFYFQLGGNRFIKRYAAMREISSLYNSVAKTYHHQKSRRAAISLYKRAIAYWPYDLGLYFGLISCFLLNKKADHFPAWQIEKPLPEIPIK